MPNGPWAFPGGGQLMRSTSPEFLKKGNPDLILLAVSDAQIGVVARSLAGFGIPMAHTSGAVAMGELVDEQETISGSSWRNWCCRNSDARYFE